MKKHTLVAQNRDLVGRKVKNLRQQGLIPATIYGRHVKSVSVSVKVDEFARVYKEAGESGLVELTLDKALHPVLVHNLQREPVLGTYLHVEFYQVDLKEKVQTKVPVEFVGEPSAVANKTGVLLTIHDEVEVEALPADLPQKLVLDVAALAEVHAEVKVKDIKVPAGVTVLTDAELTLAKIGSLVSREAEAQEVAETAAAAAASAEAGGAAAETGAPAEGTAPTPAPSQKKEEEKKKNIHGT